MASGSQGLTRLRHRRVLAFLRGQGHDAASNALLHEARFKFSVEHMKQLVAAGLWDGALEYLDGFLPACARSFGAQVMHNFLVMHRHIAGFAAGDQAALDAILTDEWMRHVACVRPTPDEVVPHVMARSVLFLDDVRACLDWEKVRLDASHQIGRLVWLTPELSGSSRTLSGRHVVPPHELLPVGFGLSRIRRMKKQGMARVKPSTVIRVLRRSRRYIRRLKFSTFESFDESKECLSALIDNSLRGGLHVGCYMLQPSGKEGAPDLPIWKVTSCAGSVG